VSSEVAIPLVRPPAIAGIVVHWHNEQELARLVEVWPQDRRFELVVVDNGSSQPLPEGDYRLIQPGRNLGFAGGVNTGIEATEAPAVLLLNPDALPEPGALDSLQAGLDAYPETAGLAPRLLDFPGPGARQPGCQHRWQLRPLPSPARLLREALWTAPLTGARREPESGAIVEQPAAAALLLRRSAWKAVGGLDEGFYPAWFEDVDLAKRLAAAGFELRYWPAARFRHSLGASVPRLGYSRFLWTYQRNQHRYVAKHHGPWWAALVRGATLAGALLRLLALPLRKPRRAASRRLAAAGLCCSAVGALTGWRWPRRLVRQIPSSPGRRAQERA
jgi:hypothetical protein